MTDELKDGAVQAEANAASMDQNPDRAAAATAVADEPSATEAVEAATTDEAAPEAAASDAAEAVTEPGAAPEEGAADPVAPAEPEAEAAATVAEEAPAEAPAAAAPDAPATDVEAPAAEAAGAESAIGDEVVASTATMPLPPELDTDDTADAPSASEDEDEPAAAPAPAPRDLGPEPTTMEELLAEQDSDIKSFKHGDVVEGTVVRIDKDEILVDIGAKSEGVVSNRELYGRHAESQPQLAIGDTVLVYVLQPESQEGHAVLSLRRAGLERKWRAMQEQFEAGVIIEAPVIDHNKGGLIVDCGIRGFVPISQIVD
ncbi:MAG TPA: S1 RNA-binding domain-containing protein, partial [Candidatus Limnocylindrales bacterium]